MVQRKHRLQMTPAEIQALEARVQSEPSWVVKSFYLDKRMEQRRITRVDIFKALRYGRAIEYKTDGRVVMRGEDGTCVVAHLDSHTVITTWYNAPSDNHATLNLAAYQWRTDIREALCTSPR